MQKSGRPLEDHDLRGRLALKRATAPLRHQWSDEPADTFLAYVEQILAPSLKPGDIVVLARSSALTRWRACAKRSRPQAQDCSTCRPIRLDFHPIEQLFAKIKALLRKAAERSVDGLWSRIKPSRRLHTPGMRQLPPQRRACFMKSGKRSNRARCWQSDHIELPMRYRPDSGKSVAQVTSR